MAVHCMPQMAQLEAGRSGSWCGCPQQGQACRACRGRPRAGPNESNCAGQSVLPFQLPIPYPATRHPPAQPVHTRTGTGMPASHLGAAVQLGAPCAMPCLLRVGCDRALRLCGCPAAGAARRAVDPVEEVPLEPSQQLLGQGCTKGSRGGRAVKCMPSEYGHGKQHFHHAMACSVAPQAK